MDLTRRTTLRGCASLSLLAVAAGCLGGEESSDLSIVSFELIDRDQDETVADLHDDHWHGSLPQIPAGDHISIGARVEDEEQGEISLGEDQEFALRAEVPEGSPDGHAEIDAHGDHVHIQGVEAGVTDVRFQLWHDDHADFETPPIDVQVIDE